MSEVYVLAVRSDWSVVHVAFQTAMRSPTQPRSGGWMPTAEGTWTRNATEVTILHDLKLFEESWLKSDGLSLVSWRRISQAEHDLFDQDRPYRDALEVVNDKLQHNMPKAREHHRARLRHIAGDRLMRLDREWVNASAEDDKPKVRAVQAKRQRLNDLPNDSRIEAARTLAELKQVVYEDDDDV